MLKFQQKENLCEEIYGNPEKVITSLHKVYSDNTPIQIKVYSNKIVF